MVPAGSRTAVPHATRAGLTSGFGWDRVYPRRCGRHTKFVKGTVIFNHFYISPFANPGLDKGEIYDGGKEGPYGHGDHIIAQFSNVSSPFQRGPYDAIDHASRNAHGHWDEQ